MMTTYSVRALRLDITLYDLFEPFYEGAGLCTCQTARRIDGPQIQCRERPFVEHAHHFARFELGRKPSTVKRS
jgi:hypothetical protein